jgi:hypothetical protein
VEEIHAVMRNLSGHRMHTGMTLTRDFVGPLAPNHASALGLPLTS